MRGPGLIALLATFVAPSLAWGEGEALRCPEFPVPRGGDLQWVAPNLRYSGVPLQIKELTTDLTPQQILAFYRAQWGTQPPYYHEYEVGEWKAIATMKQRCFYTVQVKSGDRGTQALLGVSMRPDNFQAKVPGAGFPTLSGSKVVNDIDHYDEGKTARTLLIMNSYSPEMNADYYRRTLKSDGWVAIVDRKVPGAHGLSHVMVLKLGHNEANLTISPADSGSTISVMQVDRP